LERVDVVAFSLLVGGIILLFVDKWFSKENVEEELSYKSAFIVGLFQSISMIPGVSRSASTIIGGLTQKVTRKSAAEFSFFLAVPTMFAATIKSIYDERELVMASMDKIHLLLIGNIVAFVVAMIAIKFFISFLTKYGFKVFGYYRIVLGLSILLLMAMGVKLEMQ